MGQVMSMLATPLQSCTGSVSEMLNGRRKRKRSVSSVTSSDSGKENEMVLPKKKKLLTTTQYIYEALFKQEKNSDVSVIALGKVWQLHKIYLCQSPYFFSMFNGAWQESKQEIVNIKIIDDRITLDALDAVFGSMYSDEIDIDVKDVISVLATATLFHLESIIEKCSDVMIESIGIETAIVYYEAATRYGCLNVKKCTFEWLEKNLLCSYTKKQRLLRSISVELMTKLVSSHDLYVMQTEFSLYTLLRNWMYLRLHPDFDTENQSLQNVPTNTPNSTASKDLLQQTTELSDSGNPLELIHTYFVERSKSICFLATPAGQEYIQAFQSLRTQYLTNHQMDLKIIFADNIIPKEWLNSHVLSHWSSILKVDHLPEEGPQNLDPDVFNKNCMRCGRILLESGYQKWRWTGFNFGLDLILIAESRVLSLRRHHRVEHERLLSLQTKRQFMIRASVTSINSKRQTTFTQKTEILSLSLEKNEEVKLMTMDSKLVHPLLISVYLLVTPPTNQQFKNSILSREDVNAAIPISEIGANCERSSAIYNSDDSAVCFESPSTHTFSNERALSSVSNDSHASMESSAL